MSFQSSPATSPSRSAWPSATAITSRIHARRPTATRTRVRERRELLLDGPVHETRDECLRAVQPNNSFHESCRLRRVPQELTWRANVSGHLRYRQAAFSGIALPIMEADAPRLRQHQIRYTGRYTGAFRALRRRRSTRAPTTPRAARRPRRRCCSGRSPRVPRRRRDRSAP
jgi:hypothetical protein